MKKRTKTTDSVLKDIFDTIGEEKAAHPLSKLPVESEAPPANRLESIVSEERPAVSGDFERRLEAAQNESLLFKAEPEVEPAPAPEEAPEEPAAPEISADAVLEAETSETFTEPAPVEEAPAATIFETASVPTVSDEPGLRQEADFETSEPVAAPSAVSDPVREAPKAPAAASGSHRRVVISLVALFVVLFSVLGWVLYAQNARIERQKQEEARMAEMHPAMVRVNQIAHPGVSFKSYSVKNRKLSVKGTVTSQAQLVKFLNGINASPYFSNAIIGSIVVDAEGKKTYDFQIYADIRV